MKKILITEDEINLLMLYKMKLEASGFDTETAKNGIECINKVINYKPDLILLDLMMPKQNGFDTLEILKKKNDTRDIPVIILSNLSQADDVNQVMEMGAVEHVIKSRIDLDDLVKKIKNHLE